MAAGERAKAGLAGAGGGSGGEPAGVGDVVFGVDPGSLRLGWAVLEVRGPRVVRRASGVLQPPARWARPQRLGRLLEELMALLDDHRPSLVAVETAFVRRDPRAALVLGEARGLPLALAAMRGVEVVELSPSEVKRRVVGGGRATKAQVQEMVRVQLGLAALPPEDEADALAVALTAATARTPAAALARGAVAEARARPLAPRAAAPLTGGRAYYAAIVAAARRGGPR